MPPPTDPALEPPRGLADLLLRGVQVALVNVAIAGLVASMSGNRFGHVVLYAQCIGLSIWAIIEIGRRVRPSGVRSWPPGWRGPALVAVACALGYVIGVTLADTVLGYSSWPRYLHQPQQLARDFGPTVVFCTIVAGAFWTRGQARRQRAQVAAAAHEATLARLDLLQSQLEPHMLFNTLANLRALIAADPPRAQEMLDHLIAFLRATLAASRQSEHPLSEEFARLDDYLALMRVRMGDRLRTSASLPPELATLPVPPLLLQPLVENAIKHGLEPQRGPGELHVQASLDGATLVLRVADSGRGLDAAAQANAREPAPPSSGFGLVQIRERLHTLHGDAARFTLAPRAGGGTLAEIRLPVAAPPHS
ncbi:MAG: histidine kinase [Burkholderiales bacterium]|nr:histidine kinase [Burkholderiales bacterium]